MNWRFLLDVTPFTWSAIGTACGCGFAIGLERQLRGKPVGMRTSSLIILGTYVFVTLALSVQTGVTDPSRIIGQVVTGIGFLGAGVMLSRNGMVVGVTSAATIWTLAALGVCVALGHHWMAVKLSLLVIAILSGVDILEKHSQAFTRGVYSTYRGFRDRIDS
jgi:putative Mg2+ transporter-C (MgtC) family protein